MLKQIFALSAVSMALTIPVTADTAKRPGPGPDILVLGDSQISFGAGQVYNDFFADLENLCAPYDETGLGMPSLRNATVASLGVRSTGLHSWVATDDENKATICEVDKQYGINAGAYGIAGNEKRAYVQIGQGPDYQFCAPNRSPFQELFADGYYAPKLLVLAFLGNASQRWANDPEMASRDVALTLSQVPEQMQCIFMSTVPVFGAEVNAERSEAQANVKSAVELYGRCGFVEAYTPEAVAEIEANSQHFQRRDDGTVKDPFHPNPSAVRRVMEFSKPQMCRAIFDELGKLN